YKCRHIISISHITPSHLFPPQIWMSFAFKILTHWSPRDSSTHNLI
ncbi:hypothetical protein DBR06_SOUSAS2410065, partial [Sousa chinensis]